MIQFIIGFIFGILLAFLFCAVIVAARTDEQERKRNQM